MIEPGQAVTCPDCGKDYRHGNDHACRPLHEVVGYRQPQMHTMTRRHPLKRYFDHLDIVVQLHDEVLLDPGMGLTPREMLKNASLWWYVKGRTLMKKTFTHDKSDDRIVSGKLAGDPWDELPADDQAEIAVVWYRYVWIPSKMDAPPRQIEGFMFQ